MWNNIRFLITVVHFFRTRLSYRGQTSPHGWQPLMPLVVRKMLWKPVGWGPLNHQSHIHQPKSVFFLGVLFSELRGGKLPIPIGLNATGNPGEFPAAEARYILTASSDWSAKLWSISSGECIRTCPPGAWHCFMFLVPEIGWHDCQFRNPRNQDEVDMMAV